MTHAEFQNLCLEAGYLLGTKDPRGFAASGELHESDVHLGLFADETDGRTIHCYVDLGPVHEDMRAQVFEELLTMNAEVGSRGESVYSFDRDSGHALVSTRVDGTRITDAQNLALYIGRLKDAALQTRQRLGTDEPSSRCAEPLFTFA